MTVIYAPEPRGIWSVNDEDIIVTLLAGVRDADRVFLAADSLEVWQIQGYGETIAKLRQIPGQDLVYGIYGEGGRDAQFHKFLVDSAFSTWDALLYYVPFDVGRLDVEAAPHGVGAIIAGRIKGEVQLHAFGRFTLEGSGNSLFVGQNRLAAKVAWDVAATLAPAVDTEQRFITVMKTVVAASHPFLEPPVHVWRITPEAGCEHIRPEG